MAITLHQLAAACAVALAAAGLCAPAFAATDHDTHPKATKVLKDKAAKQKKAKAKAKKAAAPPVAADDPEPDVKDAVVAEYACEQNNKVTIYTDDKDEGHIALRWKNRLHRMDRVGTTTGALRFENVKAGLVWIGIPSKSILLDSKQSRQLANECKKPEQAAPQVATAPAEKKEG